MNTVNAILATIASDDTGVILGRTLLQKRMYFLSVLLEENHNFAPYFYGPYSSTVADSLESLLEAGFITEKSESLGAGNEFGEIRRFDYELTQAGRNIIDGQSDSFRTYFDCLNKIENHPIANNVYLLSIAAKVHLIVSEQGRASSKQIEDRAASLGWKLSSRDISQVIEYLTNLNLVSTS
jgi:uncharacterized protein YwgA